MRKAIAVIALAFAAAAGAEPATLLLYQRDEPGSERYTSRYLVTEGFLRLDMGKDEGDYLLFDRKARTIYSIAHEEKTIALVEARPMEAKPPRPLALREERAPLDGAPPIAGKVPVRHRLYSGERLCLELVAVPGLLDAAIRARAEMSRVLAAEHAATLPSIPADLHDSCDLAVNIFHADWVTRFGLPISERDFAGNRQTLTDYREKFDAPPALFRLPAGYTRYSVSALK